MNTYQRNLVIVSGLYLVSSGLGVWLSIRYNLTANLGGFLHGQDVVRDFLTGNGTALSAPLEFLLLQVVFTFLILRGGWGRYMGVNGLLLLGAVYTLAQLGEPITLRMLHPATFDPAQALVLAANVILSALMVLFGILSRLQQKSTRS